MICPKYKTCKYYDPTSYTCTQSLDKNFCGTYRKLFPILIFLFIFMVGVVIW